MASVGHPPLDIVVVDYCAGVVYDYYYNGVEDRYSIDVFLCLKFPKQQTKKKRKFRIPRPAGEMERKDTARAIRRHRIVFSRATTTPPAINNNNQRQETTTY